MSMSKEKVNSLLQIQILHFKYVWNLPSLSLAQFFLIQNELQTMCIKIYRQLHKGLGHVYCGLVCVKICKFKMEYIIIGHLTLLTLSVHSYIHNCHLNVNHNTDNKFVFILIYALMYISCLFLKYLLVHI